MPCLCPAQTPIQPAKGINNSNTQTKTPAFKQASQSIQPTAEQKVCMKANQEMSCFKRALLSKNLVLTFIFKNCFMKILYANRKAIIIINSV